MHDFETIDPSTEFKILKNSAKNPKWKNIRIGCFWLYLQSNSSFQAECLCLSTTQFPFKASMVCRTPAQLHTSTLNDRDCWWRLRDDRDCRAKNYRSFWNNLPGKLTSFQLAGSPWSLKALPGGEMFYDLLMILTEVNLTDSHDWRSELSAHCSCCVTQR